MKSQFSIQGIIETNEIKEVLWHDLEHCESSIKQIIIFVKQKYPRIDLHRPLLIDFNIFHIKA